MKNIFFINKNNFQKGSYLIELLMVIALTAVLLPALLTGFAASRENRPQMEQRQKALQLLREGQEAVRVVRENNWNDFAALSSNTQTYYPKIVGSTWTLSPGPHTENGFTTSITINNVDRDFITPEMPIVPTGTLDPSTKKVTTTIAWETPTHSSATATEYLTRKENQTFTQNGSIDPPAGGHGNWCSPNLNINSYDVSGNGIAQSVFSIRGASAGNPNKAFLSTGDNAASSSLYSLNITDPVYPASPSVTTNKTFNDGKDYGLFVNSDYVYVAAGNVPGSPKRAVDILNALTLTRAGYFDTDTKMTAYSVSVSGTTGYVTADSNLIAFSASPVNGTSTSQTKLWIKGLNNNAKGNKIVTSGNYAYIATSDTSNSRQLQVVELSNPGHPIYSPPSSGNGSINTNQPGIDLAIQGNFAFLVTGYSNSSTPDIFIINITNPVAPIVVGTANTYFKNTSMIPLGVASESTLHNNSVAIVIGDGGWQYQVFQVSSGGSISRCPETVQIPNSGALQNPNGATKIQGVSTLQELDGDVYSYILTTNGSNQKFQIIEGGDGGAGVGNGIFESSTLDTGFNVAFNYFTGTIDTDLSYKIDIEPATGGVCPASYSNFVNISTGQIAIPGVSYSNPGRCLRYQVINSGTTTKSYNVNINYSP